MKKTNILYWIITGLMGAMLVMGSIPDIMNTPEVVTLFKHLGYPLYLPPFLGIAKILGVIAILVPGFPRLKEWAYAGITFDLLGATYSSIAVGDPASQWMFMFIGFALLAASYILYHKRTRAAAALSIA